MFVCGYVGHFASIVPSSDEASREPRGHRSRRISVAANGRVGRIIQSQICTSAMLSRKCARQAAKRKGGAAGGVAVEAAATLTTSQQTGAHAPGDQQDKGRDV